MSYKNVSLFGGSIEADYPDNFADVSDIRQVPDHQEVYLQKDGYTSIVFEILEYVDQPDNEALEYHLKDIVEEDVGQMRIISTAETHLTKLPAGIPAYTLLATSPPGEKQRGRAKEPDFVAIYLTLLRLKDKKTDIIINVNVPFIEGHYDAQQVNLDAAELGELGDRAQQIQQKILQTLEIKDWSLFVSE